METDISNTQVQPDIKRYVLNSLEFAPQHWQDACGQSVPLNLTLLPEPGVEFWVPHDENVSTGWNCYTLSKYCTTIGTPLVWKRQCVSWDNEKGHHGEGDWSLSECGQDTKRANSTHVLCQCRRLSGIFSTELAPVACEFCETMMSGRGVFICSRCNPSGIGGTGRVQRWTRQNLRSLGT